MSAVLVGRRLGGPILAAALVFSGALAALAFGLGLAGTVALLTVAGAAIACWTVATRTLLQRSVPPQLIGRIFGVLEGLMMAGYAVGALLVPALVHLGGNRLALLGVAAVLPLAAAAGGRAAVPPRRRGTPCRSWRSRCCARSRCSPNCLHPRSKAWRRP